MTPVPEVPVVSEERLDQRMAREKLESAIAWFSGEERPSNRRVTRGDLKAMLLELKARRAADAQTSRCVECGQLAITNQPNQTGREG
jgi:hypothetical protein